MGRNSISQAALAVAAVAQAAFAARGASMSPWLVYIWTAAGIALACELLWKLRWSRLWRAAACVACAAAIGLTVWAVARLPTLSLDVKNEFMTQENAYLKRKWVRAYVQNDSSRDASCRAYLDDMWKVLDTGESEIFPTNKTEYQLGAANGGDPDIKNGFLIPGGAGRFFNVFSTQPDSNELSADAQEWKDVVHQPLPPGTYKIKIEVSGRDCPTTFKEFKIRYDGDTKVFVIN